MMKHYRFAHLFVRLSRLLGLLIILSGLSYAVYRGFVRFKEAYAARYRQSAELKMLLAKVEAEGVRASKILQDVLSANTSSSPLEFPILQKEAASSIHFDKILETLQQFQLRTKEAKANTVAIFEKNINELRSQLLKHAESIAGPKVPASDNQVDLSQQNAVSTEASYDKDNLFINLSNETRGRRIEEMGKVWSYLDQLQKVSEQEESKVRLKAASQNLLILIGLIPIPLEIKAQSYSDSSGSSVKIREDTKADQVAAALLQATRIVRQSVLEPWKIDEAIEQAFVNASAEKVQFETDEEHSRALYFNGIEEGAIIAVQSIVLWFLVLVVADFLQTQLDIALNTRTAAEALDKATIETAV